MTAWQVDMVKHYLTLWVRIPIKFWIFPCEEGIQLALLTEIRCPFLPEKTSTEGHLRSSSNIGLYCVGATFSPINQTNKTSSSNIGLYCVGATFNSIKQTKLLTQKLAYTVLMQR
jgi:hypothetical protein